jgi:hypothetical protein
MNPNEPSELAFQPRCRHLRSKEMYYQAPGQMDDEFSSGVYWCGKTQENFGPDGEPVGTCECSSSRTCCLI